MYTSGAFESFYSGFNEFNLKLFEKVKSNLKTDPDSILDLGCGTGTSTRSIAKVFGHSAITGIDINEELIRFAKSTFIPPNVHFRIQSADSVLNDVVKYDLAIVKSALHLFGDSFDPLSLIDILTDSGTLCLIEKTHTSILSYLLMDDAKSRFISKASEDRRRTIILEAYNSPNLEITTTKLGSKVKVPRDKYLEGIKNKQMSCLWVSSEEAIENWIASQDEIDDLISIFEEFDIALIRRESKD